MVPYVVESSGDHVTPLAIIISVIAVTIVIIIVLLSINRTKLRQQRRRNARIRAVRRDSWIGMKNAADEQYTKNLPKTISTYGHESKK